MTFASVRDPVDQARSFNNGRNTVVTTKGVAWMSVAVSNTAYLYYWNGSAWAYSGLSRAATTEATCLALDPIAPDILWWAVSNSSSYQLYRVNLGTDHLTASSSYDRQIANPGSDVAGLDMVVTDHPADGTRRLHVIFGRYYTDTQTTYTTVYYDSQRCNYGYWINSSELADHTHGASTVCPCNGSTCTSLQHYHSTSDGNVFHSHSASCGSVVASNACSEQVPNQSTTNNPRWYYERWVIDASNQLPSRDTQTIIRTDTSSSDIDDWSLAIDWNHNGSGRTPAAANPVVYLAYSENDTQTTGSIAARTVTYSGGAWTINGPASWVVGATVVNASISAVFDGTELVIGAFDADGSLLKAASWDGATFTDISPAQDTVDIDVLMGAALAVRGGDIYAYRLNWDDPANLVQVRRNVYDGASWSGWEAVDSIASTVQPNAHRQAFALNKHANNGLCYGALIYDGNSYAGVAGVSDLSVPGGAGGQGWGFLPIG